MSVKNDRPTPTPTSLAAPQPLATPQPSATPVAKASPTVTHQCSQQETESRVQETLQPSNCATKCAQNVNAAQNFQKLTPKKESKIQQTENQRCNDALNKDQVSDNDPRKFSMKFGIVHTTPQMVHPCHSSHVVHIPPQPVGCSHCANEDYSDSFTSSSSDSKTHSRHRRRRRSYTPDFTSSDDDDLSRPGDLEVSRLVSQVSRDIKRKARRIPRIKPCYHNAAAWCREWRWIMTPGGPLETLTNTDPSIEKVEHRYAPWMTRSQNESFWRQLDREISYWMAKKFWRRARLPRSKEILSVKDLVQSIESRKPRDLTAKEGMVVAGGIAFALVVLVCSVIVAS